jgi:integrase
MAQHSLLPLPARRFSPVRPAHFQQPPPTSTSGTAWLMPAFALSSEQVELIAAELPAPYDLMVRFLAYTGLRAGELAALKIEDVLITRTAIPKGVRWGGEVRVRVSARKTKGEWEVTRPKSRKSKREVTLLGWLAEDLNEYIEAHPLGRQPNTPLFPNRRVGGYTHGTKHPGTPRQGDLDWTKPIEPSAFYRNVFKPAVRRAGLPPTRLHDLRHTFASLMLTAKQTPYWISEQMGHSSYVVTLNTYARIIKEHTEADAHPAEDALPRPTKPATATVHQLGA